MYYTVHFIIKMSLLAFYIRLSRSRKFRRLIFLGMGLNAGTFFTNMYAPSPIEWTIHVANTQQTNRNLPMRPLRRDTPPRHLPQRRLHQPSRAPRRALRPRKNTPSSCHPPIQPRPTNLQPRTSSQTSTSSSSPSPQSGTSK